MQLVEVSLLISNAVMSENVQIYKFRGENFYENMTLAIS